ncbi:outer membrane protein [Acetobacter pasteurianus NBRC 101655]|uniref:Hint domain-containing protein n=2 Tax=Acetobacter pasteurianus TaxID=438 RepID=UPI00038439F8|nr:Hint domain-containing protein [Acetobacter pasteurianus]BAU37484.1 outer membrane protein [Acetobacter pasteurianus NBRC 101655]CCT59985.1 outer membrane protein [Acetobacter pasteurianus 386B]
MAESIIFKPTNGSQSVIEAVNGVVTINESGNILGTAYISSEVPLADPSQATTGTISITNNADVTAANWNIGDSSGATAAVTVSDGASLTLDNSDKIASGSTVIVGNSGTLVLDGVSSNTPGQIQFSGGNGTIEVGAGTNLTIIQYITNISVNDTIVLDGTIADGVVYEDGVYTLTDNGKPIQGTASFQLPAANEGSTFTVTNVNGKTYLNATTVVCFLAGSMIRTSEGDVAVEDIQIGDQLVTFDWKHNKEVTHPVVWVGKAHAMVRAGLPDDEAGYPVRVLKDAIADGVPYKDMLITAEHCLFFEGKFVPVRMLVNGVSIFYDKSITSYDYYHVETDQHSVITADGMLTESYLDTGNRRAFRQEGKVATLRGAVQSWVEDAGAPLCVDRAFVEPLFHKLEARENSVTGCQMPTEQAVVVADPNLHLVTQAGAIIRPMRHEGQRYSFMLPANTQSVRIVSRASRPADVIGPFVDDRRQMGVAVADVHFITAKKLHPITAHLQAHKPEGWHDTDWTDCAWTNGNAVLPLGDFTKGSMGLLSLTVRAAGPYLLDESEKQVQVLSA